MFTCYHEISANLYIYIHTFLSTQFKILNFIINRIYLRKHNMFLLNYENWERQSSFTFNFKENKRNSTKVNRFPIYSFSQLQHSKILFAKNAEIEKFQCHDKNTKRKIEITISRCKLLDSLYFNFQATLRNKNFISQKIFFLFEIFSAFLTFSSRNSRQLEKLATKLERT